MYFIKKDIELTALAKYGFKKGCEYPEHHECIDNEPEYEDYWLFAMNPDDPSRIYFVEDCYPQPVWSIHITARRGVLLDFTPQFTYHVDSDDVEHAFTVIYRMIKDDIIECPNDILADWKVM